MGTLSDSTKVAIKVLDLKDNKEAQKKRFDAESLLLDADMVARVSDFGISKILAENKSDAKKKTIGYIAPEYGSDGTVSTKGDVYSYGIMLMEVVTRRKPTDELFGENRSLRQWVKAAYYYNTNSLMEVIDANLFQEEENGLLLLEINSHHNIITCLSSVIELSSKKAPQDRINMKDAMVRLNKIKQRFLQTKGYCSSS
ncbi:hypothetical protein ACP275_10G143100 [Erythranthe tilingii]